MSGQGHYRLPGSYQYQGQFAGGLFNGPGVIEFDDGSHYEGEFKNDRMHGEGMFTDASGMICEGQFAQDDFIQGSCKYSQGGIYTGSFENWLLQGEGTLVRNDVTWHGEFHQGELSGTATVTQSDGTHYEGEIEHWTYSGSGTLTMADGSLYSGGFKNGRYSGEGTLTTAEGEVQSGEFARGRLNGKGRIDYPNGDWFEGQFRYGKPWGHGTSYTAETETEISGDWQNKTLIARSTDKGVDYLGSTVERALYNQQALLQKQLDAIKATDADDINLYVLLVAGNGRQGVFYREAVYAEALFSHQYQADGRILSLINSPETVDTTPMATVTSIDRAIQALAEKMDKENDILFVYMTSHGSEDFHLQLNQNGLNLPGLSADYLAQSLNQSAIQHRVVVISACYSGGFVEPLAGPETLVMTAAASDRTSFGCSDEAEFTYFGRALLEQALNQTNDFSQGFHIAYDLVDEWENEKDFRHSLPQLSAPEPVLSKLEDWYKTLPEFHAEKISLGEKIRWWWRENDLNPASVKRQP
ncbi:MAG: peptidase C13 [Oceanospirillaceae bacterium]|nr:peptidase C13 [Oceanospirillaceae bacterium]MBT13978.1 peptidase C13 [Oceanospirillaceae bacterium]|tara:strand:+ start:2377 stop:3960 length:1584 start_codon:yes stop_codon:yes gene_type:complete